MQYFGYFIITFFASLFATALVRILMQKYHIVDAPRTEKRKIHKKKIPLGGGMAIFFSFFLITFLLLSSHFGNDVLPRHIWGLFWGGLVLMIGGLLDDKYNLRAKKQIIFPILAATIIIAFGIGPHEITNPWGGVVSLDQWTLSLAGLGNWVILADLVVFFWLMGMMFTTKFLDGLDGLVTGVVTIGAMMIFALSLQEPWYQPEVALLSIIFAGSCLGFLAWNWHPAKIFLGEGGSLFTGFMIGALAIISGGKIATTLLVMGIPALDVIRVIIRRIQKKKPIHVGDSEHLHFKLIESGLTQKQAVLLMYAISFLFGVTTLFLQSSEKMIALVLLFILMLLLGVWFSKKKGL